MLAALVIPCGVALLFPQHRAIAPTTAGRVSSRPVVALAGGGFGAAKAPAKPKKKGKGKKGAVPAHTEKALRDLNASLRPGPLRVLGARAQGVAPWHLPPFGHWHTTLQLGPLGPPPAFAGL